jgi:hypothetical protein
LFIDRLRSEASVTIFPVALPLRRSSRLAEQADQIEKELEQRRAKTFPLALFGRGAFAPWAVPAGTLKPLIETFLDERAKVDTETRRLVELFKAASRCQIIRGTMIPGIVHCAGQPRPSPRNVSP